MSFDDSWADAVRRWCDPVFEAADRGFEFNDTTYDDEHPQLLGHVSDARDATATGVTEHVSHPWTNPVEY